MEIVTTNISHRTKPQDFSIIKATNGFIQFTYCGIYCVQYFRPRAHWWDKCPVSFARIIFRFKLISPWYI